MSDKLNFIPAYSGIPTFMHTPHQRDLRAADIDAIDPAYAPGNGTPEVGGFTSYQMQQRSRGPRGLDIVGADLVAVNPLYYVGGMTAVLAANLAFELLSLLALNI